MANVAPTALNAAQIIQEANDKSYRAAALGEQAGMKAVLGAKTDSLNATIKQTVGEQKDSLVKFGSSGIGMMTNAKLALHGAGPNKPIRQMKDEADAAFAARQSRSNATRAAASSVANGGSASQLVDKTTEAMSQAMGPQADINQAKVSAKLAELAETMGKTQQESSKNAKDAVVKAQDSANDFLKGAFDRAAQTINKAFGG